MPERRTLHLVSPKMKDGQDKTHRKDVSDAQYLLNNNVFKEHYYLGVVDGDYGEMTAQGAYRAKFWLGYPLHALDFNKKVNQHFGNVLFEYLHGDRKPTPYMRLLRKQRLAAAKSVPLGVKAVQEAKKWVGTKESPPESNQVKFSYWYGMIGAWCAMFVTWCYVIGANSKAFVRGQRYAYVPYLEADARAGQNNLTITRNPVEGDPVCFDWDDDGISDHVGLFLYWIDRNAGSFHTIEGNTSGSNNSNGGEVMFRDRYISDVSFKHTNQPAFIHVGR